MALLLADVSNAQRDDKGYLQSLKNNGVKGVCVKMTEGSAAGTAYKNENRVNQFNFTKDLGMIPSAYHFARFENNSDAEAEAKFFISTLAAITSDKNTPVMLDAEVKTAADYTAASIAFLNYLKSQGYKNLAVYSMQSFFTSGTLNVSQLKAAGAKIWIASYGILTKPANSDIWQYNDSFKGFSQDISWDYGTVFTIKQNGGGGNSGGGGSANNNADDVRNGKTKKATETQYCLSLLALFIDSGVYDTWLH